MKNRWILTLAWAGLLVAGCQSRGGTGIPASGIAPGGSGPVSGQIRVSYLDVGQGDSALIQVPGGEDVLIDGGPGAAGPVVLQDLRTAGVSKIDLLLGTHPHEDHIGGLIDVLREVPVQQVLDPGYAHGTSLQRKYLELLKEKAVKTTRARKGQRYDLGGGANLEILAPEDPLIKGTRSDPNNNSIVARLVYGKTAFLFTGDMEEEERARLLQSVPHSQLRADVLKVAHHGSHNGTDPEFLAAVQPRYAVISLARHNDYGHPHREAIEALEGAHAEILRTDERGTITFTSNGQAVQPQNEGTRAAAPSRSSPSRKATASSPRTAVAAGRVIGNRESHVYHAPNCPRLPSPGKRVNFGSIAEAEQAGYHAHAACVKAMEKP